MRPILTIALALAAAFPAHPQTPTDQQRLEWCQLCVRRILRSRQRILRELKLTYSACCVVLPEHGPCSPWVAPCEIRRNSRLPAKA